MNNNNDTERQRVELEIFRIKEAILVKQQNNNTDTVQFTLPFIREASLKTFNKKITADPFTYKIIIN